VTVDVVAIKGKTICAFDLRVPLVDGSDKVPVVAMVKTPVQQLESGKNNAGLNATVPGPLTTILVEVPGSITVPWLLGVSKPHVKIWLRLKPPLALALVDVGLDPLQAM
jgi:hypothetical protein